MTLTELRVRDARRLVADVEAADITNPELPPLKAVELLSRITTQLRILAEHAEQQQRVIAGLEGEVRRLRGEASQLWVESATRDAEAEVAA